MFKVGDLALYHFYGGKELVEIIACNNPFSYYTVIPKHINGGSYYKVPYQYLQPFNLHSHTLKEYVGLIERFNYCIECDYREGN